MWRLNLLKVGPTSIVSLPIFFTDLINELFLPKQKVKIKSL
jgi:hypothetical protein